MCTKINLQTMYICNIVKHLRAVDGPMDYLRASNQFTCYISKVWTGKQKELASPKQDRWGRFILIYVKSVFIQKSPKL